MPGTLSVPSWLTCLLFQFWISRVNDSERTELWFSCYIHSLIGIYMMEFEEQNHLHHNKLCPLPLTCEWFKGIASNIIAQNPLSTADACFQCRWSSNGARHVFWAMLTCSFWYIERAFGFTRRTNPLGPFAAPTCSHWKNRRCLYLLKMRVGV